MLLLALETSCDETAASVVSHEAARRARVVSSVVASQYELHAEYAGVVPEIASRAHVEAILPTVREALSEAGVGLGMIDAVAVGNRPGLIGSLLVGVAAAKSLAWSLRKPLIGVDHVLAHLYSGLLVDEASGDQVGPSAAEIFPALGLVVSGGHTAMYQLSSWTDVTRVGSTIDDAMGEAYDKVATILGLPHPGGPNLDRLASGAGADEKAFDLPISRLSTTSLDFSFSGLKTAVLYAVRGVPVEGEYPAGKAVLSAGEKANLAASFQRAACRAITIKLERALVQGRDRGVAYRSLLTGGGVTANSRLRRDLTAFAEQHKLRAYLPPMRYCMDNAAMIGGLGGELLRAGASSDMALQAVPTASR
jgi:N6-L-threonylcarbamoyladenine synthase